MSFEFDADTLYGSLAFAALSCLFLALVLRQLYIQKASRRWPITEGHIQTTTVSRGDEGGLQVAYTYSYQVTGCEYTGAGSLSGTPPTELIAASEARAALGRRLDVAYNPRDPAIATDSPGDTTSAAPFLLVVTGFYLLGIWFVAKWWF
jgi:hypothetical protein